MDLGATLRIKLADAGSIIESDIVVDRETVMYWSSCAKGLPETAGEWDLSQLLIEGKPVQRSTVIAWLNAIFNMVYSKQFEHLGPFAPDPCADAAGLAQLLAFADAVGSPRGLVVAFLLQLSELKFTVTWDNIVVKLSAVGRSYWRRDNSTVLRTSWGDQSVTDCVTLPNFQARTVLIQQAAAATESVLLLAYKLQLPNCRKWSAPGLG